MISRLAIFKLKKVSPGHRSLYLVALLISFWIIFDGIITYIVPNLITSRGYSETAMGLIVGSSSVFGIMLDFFLTRILKHTNYLKIFFFVLLIALTYPLVLWFSSSILMFLLAMFIWGLYWDLYNFAVFDYVSQELPAQEHCFGFGVIGLFRSLALFVAPLIAGLLVTDSVSFYSLTFPLIFLFAALLVYVVLFIQAPHHHFHSEVKHIKNLSFRQQFSLLFKLGRIYIPFLLIIVLLNIFDAFFWTIGPLFSPFFPDFKDFGGIVMAIYMLPSVFTIWKLEPIIKYFGKTRSAFISFFLCCLCLIPIGFTRQPFIVLACVFMSSIFSAITWPAFDGLYADFIQASGQNQTEMEALNDMATNAGYVVGPILSGFLVDKINISFGFSFLGLGSLIFIILIYILFYHHFYPAKTSAVAI